MILFRVVDLKQYIYCPRLIYYHHCLPQIRPITYKMEAGLAAQDEEELREARRSLRVYGLKRGECQSNVSLESEGLGLRGQVDLVIKTDDNPLAEVELIPVDYKLSDRQLGLHFKLQLVAYGLLLQEHYELPVKRGFLYSIPRRRAVEVAFTPTLRTRLTQALVEMKEITLKEFMPTPTRQRAKCESCEFRRFCNDVV
jgi:CRISPR-associated exonuclease Cas4